MLILGIETSCDETAAAVVEDGRRVLSGVVSSQDEIHSAYGGVVPELASRKHLDNILPVVSAYYPKLRVSNKIILIEMIASVLSSIAWYFVRNNFSNISFVNEIEPMLVGLFFAVIVHFGYLFTHK